jgi:hypothetical protein
MGDVRRVGRILNDNAASLGGPQWHAETVRYVDFHQLGTQAKNTV